jgi:acyl-CoA reductase-like NAD-dependent aldehyde dehydrogenase
LACSEAPTSSPGPTIFTGNNKMRLPGEDLRTGLGGHVVQRLRRRHRDHAALGGYKQSGIGRENHPMMLDHYQQTKNLLVSYSNKALGFF